MSAFLSLPFPNASSPNYPGPSLTRGSGMQRQLLFPFSITKHNRLKATIADASFGKDDVKPNKGPAVVGGEELPAGLQRELMPKHVAFILDGNRRWAEKRGWSTDQGHESGARTLKELARTCAKWGIKVVTVFAFSTENWGRPEGEIGFLMRSFERFLKSELPTYEREVLRVSVIGCRSRIPKSLANVINEVEEATKDNSGFHLIIAIDYSGRYDILQASKSIAEKVKDGAIQVEDVNESLIEQELETKCTEFPCPDLLVRTSGEIRVSNFLMWQLAYTQLFFTPVFWPDFGEDEMVEALTWFQQSKRPL